MPRISSSSAWGRREQEGGGGKQGVRQTMSRKAVLQTLNATSTHAAGTEQAGTGLYPAHRQLQQPQEWRPLVAKRIIVGEVLNRRVA